MKYIYLFLLFISCLTDLTAQRERIQELESTLSDQEGKAFVDATLELARLYYEEEMYELSDRRARDAYNSAKKMDEREEMALSLNWQAKAMIGVSGGRRGILNRAFRHLEESNELTTELDLRMDNLVQMQELAARLNKIKELKRIQYEIAVLNGKNPPAPDEGLGGIFNSKKRKALEQYKAIREEKQGLSQEVDSLSEEQASLLEQQKDLINILVEKETAIKNMSEEQMKRELILSEQERLLDSLAFSMVLDSLELSQAEMLVQQKEIELREQEAELRFQKSQRNLFLALAGAGLLLAIGLFHRYHVMRGHNAVLEEKNKVIESEKKRSEELLLNILPKAVADELKVKGEAVTQHYDNATVMFVDFKGFSKISKQLSARQLVADLDYAFTNFDAIIEKYGLEKIKTIGDAYMCAGGLPSKDKSHPENVVRAALEIQHFLYDWNKRKLERGEPVFDARIGVHTGPLVAGVVGSKKFAYDIWGDTVNVASRMETSCEPGRVNISASTYEWVNDLFECEYRGKVPAKNVGEVEMYYVQDGRR